MHYLRNLSAIILFAMLSGGATQSQDVTRATKHYEKDGITFDYPTGWTVMENNSPDTQTVTAAPGGNATQILISIHQGFVPSCDFEGEAKRITSVFGERLAKVIKAGAATESPVTTELGATKMEGIQLHGFIDDQPALGDVYSIRLNRQFVSLAFVRKVDDSSASSAWQTVRSSLKVEAPFRNVLTVAAAKGSGAVISGGVMNGKAISLPRPDYPPIARSAHASGTVVVQVVIDETGDVVAAHAVAGHPLLQAASVAAARQAKFSPTKLCGEPVKVTGVITYNFVAM
ncbi:MAG TPA: TonB family protein [Pyrinomonadaceae bacterium]|nr:TonB family protein [Pyrinomonadaceae bacterium]